MVNLIFMFFEDDIYIKITENILKYIIDNFNSHYIIFFCVSAILKIDSEYFKAMDCRFQIILIILCQSPRLEVLLL